MKTYSAKKGVSILAILVLVAILPFIFFIFDPATVRQTPIIFLPLSMPLLLSLWIYTDTRYSLIGDTFYYRSAFIRGTIKVSKIKKLEVGRTLWVGTRPALATRGVIIHYNKYDSLYVAPVSNEELVQDLLVINPSIKVIKHEEKGETNKVSSTT